MVRFMKYSTRKLLMLSLTGYLIMGIILVIYLVKLHLKKPPRTIETITDLIYQDECISYSAEYWRENYARKSDLKSNIIITNPHSFGTVATPTKRDPNKEIYMIVLIHSAPDHFVLRDRIRRTWGTSENYPWLGKRVEVIFVLGKPEDANDKSLLRDIREEIKIHGDILMSDYIDAYRELVHKARAGLKYIGEHYVQNVRYVLKADDDLFINVFRIFDLLDKFGDCLFHGRARRILCRPWIAAPKRDSNDKFYVGWDEFPNRTYPDFCAGAAWLTTPDVARDLNRASLATPTFRFDDVYVTGILREKAGVSLVNATNQFRLFDSSETDSKNDVKNSEENLNFLHRVSNPNYFRLWEIHANFSKMNRTIHAVL